jgi:hypothetical protein
VQFFALARSMLARAGEDDTAMIDAPKITERSFMTSPREKVTLWNMLA